MALFGIDLPVIVSTTLDSAAQAATLIVVAPGTRTALDLGGGTNPTTTNVPCRGFVNEFTQDERAGTKIREDDKKVALFVATLGGTVPKASDRVTIDGDTYDVIKLLGRDPAAVRFLLHCRL